MTVEGIEGSGKSTLADSLAEALRNGGAEAIVTQEPGGDEVATAIRRLLLDSAETITDTAELLLFEAARAQHVEVTIKPALGRGATVICDRFADSSMAYQGYARGIDPKKVGQLNDLATAGLAPDLTILLDLPIEVGLARQTAADRISSEQAAFHQRVRDGYLAIAGSEPERFAVIDATMDLNEVLRQALTAIGRL